MSEFPAQAPGISSRTLAVGVVAGIALGVAACGLGFAPVADLSAPQGLSNTVVPVNVRPPDAHVVGPRSPAVRATPRPLTQE